MYIYIYTLYIYKILYKYIPSAGLLPIVGINFLQPTATVFLPKQIGLYNSPSIMVIPKASSIYSPKIIDVVTNRSGRYSTAIQLGWDLIFSPGGRFAAKAAPCAVA